MILSGSGARREAAAMEQKRPLTRSVVQSAIDGDPDAIEAVLDYYGAYIDSLCIRTSRRKNGAVVRHIDEDMRNQIKHMFLRDLPNMRLDELPE